MPPSSPEKARASALRLLKFRPRSEAELKARLTRQGTDSATVETLIGDLRKKGLLNDAKFANLFVQQRMNSRPMGKRAMLAQLKAKGIEPALAEQTLEAATQGQDETETARALAAKRLSQLQGLSRETLARRLYGYLGRRGFSSDTIYKVIREFSEKH